QLGLQARRNVRMPVIKPELPVSVGRRALRLVQHAPVSREFRMKWCAGQRSVEHELVEVGVVSYGMLDDLVDVFWRVLFEPDDRRPQDTDSVRLEFANQSERVDSIELCVRAVLSLHPHPYPGDTQGDELLDGIRLDDSGRAEYIQHPRLIMLLHQFQQPQRSLTMEEEIL